MSNGRMQYEHEKLINAIDNLEDLGDFDKRIDASAKAGEIILRALDNFVDTAIQETQAQVKKEEGSVETEGSGLWDTREFSLKNP